MRNCRLFVSLLLSSLSLAGCHSDGDTTPDTAVVTPSTSGAVAVVSGGSQTYSIVFNPSDNRALTHLQVTTDMTALPAGWTGPASFGCTTVTTGSGCVLNLTYAPTGANGGVLAIVYTYVDAGGSAMVASRSIAYSSTTHDNVVATASTAGQVNAVVGASGQSVSVNFTTDDGNPATALALTTDLASLPAGWSSTATTFTCATVSSGSGCSLPLTYRPTAAGAGTLSLKYSYLDDSGTAKTGSLSVPYSATTADDVVATVSPTGQITAVVGAAHQSVTITFNSNDGNPTTALAVTTDLASLPPGWTAADTTFGCDSISTGNGCQMSLSYAPTAAASGTLSLGYKYHDNSGSPKSGSLNIAYAATTHDNVVGTGSPSGQINAVVGSGSQSINVTFTTDDGNVATALQVTGLGSLPADWTGPGSFACAGVSIGSGCALSLTYRPNSVGSGTVNLSYSYEDDAGAPKTASLSIPYASTVDNNVIGTASPSGQVTATIGATRAATITFVTDDGNPASSLVVTTDLSALPAGWSSSPSSFHCNTVASGNSCQLPLTFAPSASGSGTLQLNYSYTNNAGFAKTGSVSIPYVATPAHAYVGQLASVVEVCTIGSDGLLSGCTDSTVLGDAVALSNGRAYIGDYGNNVIRLCNIASAGSLANCLATGSNYFYPFVMTVSGNILYAASADYSHTIMYCPIQNDGTVGACTETSSLNGGEGLNTANGYLYISRPHDGPDGTVSVCRQALDGSLSNCATTGSGFSGPEDIAILGSFAFVANTTDGTISTCTISGTAGTLSACAKSTLAYGPMGIAVYGGRAYVSSRSGNIYVCVINGTTGALSNCVISNGGSSLGLSVQIAVH